mmetsp:Transcript_29346/g.33770  ORF Transcript_29346/g.33770 Transcript_29346/m.33770 type:complete len:80 (+) Transcript_29346:153-392(+)
MDYKGQYLSELLFYWIILAFGAVGWVIGYIKQDFSFVFYPWLAGVLIACVLCVPDWPYFNRNPVDWLSSVPDRRSKKMS